MNKILSFCGALCATLLCVGCTSDDSVGEQQPKGLMPVLFSAGNTDVKANTRAASAAYMPDDSKFACAMFFHAGASDTNDAEYAAPIQEVNMFSDVFTIKGSQGEAKRTDNKYFYWQNRLDHVFLALADNNNLSEAPEATVGEKVEFDLTRGDKTAMTQQPDPMLAWEKKSPAGATSEANRVKLFFKHQFAQIQVNLKNSQDASVTIDHTQIVSVELLGVAEKGYVTFGITPAGDSFAASSEPINVDDAKYSATIKDNPYGSLFNMFESNTTAPGYLKSFEGIAFGTLQGIRITWKESEAADAVAPHKATFQGVKNLKLESGKKYIYNLELRRSLIAQINAEIADWETDKAVYEADGTIQE